MLVLDRRPLFPFDSFPILFFQFSFVRWSAMAKFLLKFNIVNLQNID